LSRAFAWIAGWLALACMSQTGCQHIGPITIVADRLPYNEALATSWKEQTLLNIVKMRYADTPFFVDVAQITSGYSRGRSGNASVNVGQTATSDLFFGNRLGGMLGLNASYEDRPTISYTPQTGAEFIRNLSSPIPPKSVLFMIQSGYDAALVMDLLVDSINGLNNGTYVGCEQREVDPRFHALLKLLQQAQQAGNIGMRIEQDKNKGDAVVLFFREKHLSPEFVAQLAAAKQLLGIKPDQSEFKVVFGGVPKSDDEIAIMTRSIFRILTVLSFSVEVPLEHLVDGRALNLGSNCTSQTPGFVIHSSLTKPCDAYAAISYRGYWFWVDDKDLSTKRYFMFLLNFLAQTDTAAKDTLPLVTIRAN